MSRGKQNFKQRDLTKAIKGATNAGVTDWRDVKRIRALWKQCYPGKRRTTPPSAEEIAAERWGLE